MTDEPKIAATDPVPVGKRRRRASAGGWTLKLDAPTRPGFVRRWFNGDPSRLREAEDLGYTHVTEKPGEGARRTQGQGTRIERHAGRTEVGVPLSAFLMETPIEEYNVGLAEKEDRLKPFEDAINRGDDPTGELGKGEMYQPGRSTINRTG